MGKFFSLLLLLLAFQLPGHSQKEWHVYVFIGEECPVCNYMGNPLSGIAGRYEDRVSFHAVFPLKNSTYKTAQLFKHKYKMLSYETLLDKGQVWTKKLGATVTPEAVITDGQGEIYYRGRINSAYYAPGKMKHSSIRDDLEEALKTVLSGATVPIPWPPPVGCYITIYATP